MDMDSITDGSPPEFEDGLPPQFENGSARDDATVDNGEHTDEGDEAETEETDGAEADEGPAEPVRRFSWKRILAYGVLPALALILALVAAYLKWQAGSASLLHAAAAQSKQAATEATIAMLSYHPDTVDKDLTAATGRMTGTFRAEYTQLIKDVVIPGAKQKKISATATVPGAASVSVTENHAVVLVFVNQTVTIGDDVPADTASTVRITLDKVHDRWLIARFDPI